MEDSKAGKIPGSKSGKSTMSASGTNMKDFRLEYAKSGAAKCGVCEEKIKKVCGRFWPSVSQLLAHQDYSKHISNKYHQRPIRILLTDDFPLFLNVVCLWFRIGQKFC